MFRVWEVSESGNSMVGTFASRAVAQEFIAECIQSRPCGHFFIIVA